jgi:hypothetical protein
MRVEWQRELWQTFVLPDQSSFRDLFIVGWRGELWQTHRPTRTDLLPYQAVFAAFTDRST